MWTAEEYINHLSQKKKTVQETLFQMDYFFSLIFLNDLGLSKNTSPHCRSSDVQYMPQTLPSFTQCFFAGETVGAHLGTGGIKDSSPAPPPSMGLNRRGLCQCVSPW